MIDPTIRNNRAVTTGRIAQRRGDRAQSHLDAIHVGYERANVAIIDRQNPRVGGKPPSLRYLGHAPIDYLGVLIPSGRCVAMEAKSTGEAETNIPFGEYGMRLEQVQALAARGRAGALAVVVWQRGLTVGVCHWTALEGHSLTRKSVPASAFRWLSPMDWDWLPVAVALDGEVGK